jgi:predicted component of type VI protein secretion system
VTGSTSEAWLVDARWLKAYPLGAETSIGRGSDCTIILRDPAISRHHATVTRDGDGYVLHPSGSSGTKVNAVYVDSPRRLHEGDVVEIAYSSLRFTLTEPTGDMVVLPRDTPTPTDKQEGPTRITLATKRRRDAGVRWLRRHSAALLALFILALMALLLIPGSGSR